MRRPAAHVFVEDLESPALDDADAHHLARVLRLRPGEAVTASDGRGGIRACVWRDGHLEVVGPVETRPRAEPGISVAFSLTKGAKPEWAVQRLTEAGVDVIQPLVAARSVVRWEPDRAGRAQERLARVAREAAAQSRRVWLPDIAPLTPFADFVVTPEVRERAAVAHMGGTPPTLERPTVIVGPEGGWSDEELECGLPVVALGPEVLRAETAAVAAGILLAALRGGLVAPCHS